MNVFNRIVVILGILIWLFLVLVLMVRPLDATSYVRGWLTYFEQALGDLNFFYIYLGSLAGLELILLILLWLEIRKRRHKTVRIKTSGGGRAELGTQSVAQSLEYRIDELAGVRKVDTKIKSRGRDVEVTIDLDTSPSVNIPVLTDQIMDLAHEIVEKQLGVRIHGRVNLRVRHEPYPRGTMPATGSMGTEPIVPPGRATPKEEPAPAPVSRIESPTPEPAAPAPSLSLSAQPSAEEEPTSVSAEADADSTEDTERSSGW